VISLPKALRQKIYTADLTIKIPEIKDFAD